MPELPDVEVFRQYADKHALKKKISNIEYKDADKVLKSSKQKISRSLKGQKFTSTERTGKHMFLKTGDDKWLEMHFGMTGYLKFWKKDEDEPKYSKLIFEFDDDSRLSYISKRKFGEVEIIENPDQYKKEHDLGTDALECSKEEFLELVENKKGGIKNVLMDQSNIAGLGNIYTDEILFQSEIHPKTKIEKLDKKQLEELHRNMQRILKTAINNGAQPSQLPKAYLLPRREEGEDCPKCSGKIKKITVNGRSTYYCPSCQKEE